MAVLKFKNGSDWINYNDLLFPVGSIVMRYTNTSPASLIGGTWTAMTGRFPYFNSANGTGGSNTHTLTTAQMPAHNHPHTVSIGRTNGELSGYGLNTTGAFTNRVIVSGMSSNVASGILITHNDVGGGESHNNMPAYQAVWAFRRTA